MAEIDNKKVKSKHDALTERLKQRYPDRDFTDEEQLYGQILDDYDDYDSAISGYRVRERSFSDLFTEDPRSARFLMDWKDGQHPMTAFIRMYGKEGLEELVDNEEKMEEFDKAQKEYLERVAKENELDGTYQKNLDESMAMLDAMQNEKSFSDEDIDQAMDLLMHIINDGIVGKFTAESVEMALKALKHDADVAEANHEGFVQGKNEKIEMRLRRQSVGDGTHPLDGKNSTIDRRRNPESIFDLAKGAL